MTTTESSASDASVSPEERTAKRVRHALSNAPRPPEEQGGDAASVGRPRLATMIEALAPAPDATILQIGTGGGYATAVLAQLCAAVHVVEESDGAADAAATWLSDAGVDNVTFHRAAPADGWPQAAPYDGILVWEAPPGAADHLDEQLATGAHLVAAVGRDTGAAEMLRVTRTSSDEFRRESLGHNAQTAKLGDIIVSLGLADRPAVERVAADADLDEQDIGQDLIEAGVVEEHQVFRALAAQHGMRFARATELFELVDESVASSVSHSFLRSAQALPIGVEDGQLVVATSDPQADLAEVTAATGASRVRTYLVAPVDLERIRATLGVDPGFSDQDPTDVGTTVADSGGGPSATVPHSPPGEDMSETLGRLLLDAVGERATDVHLERYADEVRLRFRIDGELHDEAAHTLTPQQMQGIINVLKVESGMDMAEHLLPQDGRLRRKIAGRIYDLRVHIQPAFYAEHAVIRLLPQQKNQLDIEQLGFPPKIAQDYRRLLDSPAGLVLVVGPTGAGKSTTLFAGLRALADDATRKVITVEDPVEYAVRGVEQTQVNEKAGFGFADAMRAFVREDPDVILVGEIRDHETALEAIRASQTGHLVLSTLHANDTVDAVQRLLDLGLAPNSVASELVAVFAQRLVKRNCTACKKPVEPDAMLVEEVFPDGELPDDFTVYRGEGCSVCNGRGTLGRVAAVEFLRSHAAVREAVADKVHIDRLRSVALDAGLVTMRSSALRLVLEGIIPMSELPRVLPVERMAPERDERGAPSSSGS